MTKCGEGLAAYSSTGVNIVAANAAKAGYPYLAA